MGEEVGVWGLRCYGDVSTVDDFTPEVERVISQWSERMG
jgi:hypothetical protein